MSDGDCKEQRSMPSPALRDQEIRARALYGLAAHAIQQAHVARDSAWPRRVRPLVPEQQDTASVR